MLTRAFRITGRVQSVGYRAFVARLATSYGLAGYAKNTPDGAVVVCVSGELNSLTHLEADLHRGPPRAEVSEVIAIPPEFLTA